MVPVSVTPFPIFMRGFESDNIAAWGGLTPGGNGLGARGESRAGEKNGDCHQFARIMALETKNFT